MSRNASLSALLNLVKDAYRRVFPKKTPEGYVGIDLEGNKFFEYTRPSNSRIKRPERVFFPDRPGRIDTEFVSTEWLSWLQHRRKNPPTIEELIKNKQIADMKKINARKIAIRDGKPIQNELTSRSKYPVYKEYTSSPFKDYMDYSYLYDKSSDDSAVGKNSKKLSENATANVKNSTANVEKSTAKVEKSTANVKNSTDSPEKHKS